MAVRMNSILKGMKKFGDFTEEAISKAVEKAGYSLTKSGKSISGKALKDIDLDKIAKNIPEYRKGKIAELSKAAKENVYNHEISRLGSSSGNKAIAHRASEAIDEGKAIQKNKEIIKKRAENYKNRQTYAYAMDESVLDDEVVKARRIERKAENKRRKAIGKERTDERVRIANENEAIAKKQDANARKEAQREARKEAREKARIAKEQEVIARREAEEKAKVESRNEMIQKNRERSQRLRDKYDNPTVEGNGVEANMEYARRHFDIEEKRNNLKNNSLDTSNRGERSYERAIIKTSPAEMAKRKNEAMAKRKQNNIIKQKKKDADNLTEKLNPNNWVYKTAAIGVGGGLVLSMANNRGQQSNSQLYGQ